MPLTQDQIAQFHDAINGYAFPAVYFDFNNNLEITTQNIIEVEDVLADPMRSQDLLRIKYGLANVLYWGYAQIPYGKKRVQNFMSKISDQQITNFRDLIADNIMPTLTAVRQCHLPEYSGMSFISKILTFLNPDNFCVLDQQIAKLRTPGSPKFLNNLIFGGKETQIRITAHNEAVYNGWRNECAAISQLYFQGAYRVVDIERGFFNLIQQNNLLNAQTIYNNA
jgi:hypothetical protein